MAQTKSPTKRKTAEPKVLPRENVNEYGYFLDGWWDLVEGMGSKADKVRADVLKQLEGRKMPEVAVKPVSGHVRKFGGETRDYLITTTAPGATTTLYVGQHGKDLFASWRTFIHPILNMQTIYILVGVSVFLALISASTDFGFFFGLWVGGTLASILFFGVLIAMAGRIIKGDFLAYFIVEPNLFDAEDITAMGLSAHKSILRALDKAGIDISKLRLKQTFKGGRRGDTG